MPRSRRSTPSPSTRYVRSPRGSRRTTRSPASVRTPSRSSSLRRRSRNARRRLLGGGGGQRLRQGQADRTTSTFSNLARSAPSRLASRRTADGKTTTTAGASLTISPAQRFAAAPGQARAGSLRRSGRAARRGPLDRAGPLLADRRGRPAARVGREAVHDRCEPESARTEDAPADRRCSAPEGSGRAACGTATSTCAAAATRRSATATGTSSTRTATAPLRWISQSSSASIGIRRVTGHIFADDSLFDADRGVAGDRQPARHPGLRRRDERPGLRPRHEHGADGPGRLRRPRAGAHDARHGHAGRARPTAPSRPQQPRSSSRTSSHPRFRCWCG